MKTCSRCGVDKDSDMFNKHSSSKDGLQSWCTTCMREWRRERMQDPIVRERRRMVSNEWTRRNPDRLREYNQRHAAAAQERYRLANKDKRNAKQKVNRFIRAGKLTRLPCEVCGDPNSQAHHDSYEPDKWLDVRWLCHTHHRELHRLLKSH